MDSTLAPPPNAPASDGKAAATPYVRPDVQALLGMLAMMQQPPMSAMSPAEAREAYRMMTPVADAEPAELAVIRDLTSPGPAGDIRLRLYDARETREPGPAIVFFHGGGFVIGDLDTHHPLCSEMAHQLDVPLIAVDYRLAPEHPFPAAPADCEAAARWIAGSPAALGRTITGLVLCGDSAGGNLTIVTAQALRASPAAAPVIVQAPLYPVVDGDHDKYASFAAFGDGFLLTADTMRWFGDHYAAPLGDPAADPLFADPAGMPPTLLVTAGLDPLRDQGRDYAARLVQAGVETVYLDLPGAIHGFTCLRKGIPSAEADVQAIIRRMGLLIAAHR